VLHQAHRSTLTLIKLIKESPMARRKHKRKSHKKSRKGGGQRAKFKKAAAACRAEVGNSGAKAFSPASWSAFGKCMKREL
jgi:hypothetical protein